MIKIIFYFHRTNLSLIRLIISTAFFCGLFTNSISAQNITIDSIHMEIESDSISDSLKNDIVFITIKDSAKIFVTKGTITKNLIDNVSDKNSIVFIDKNKKTETEETKIVFQKESEIKLKQKKESIVVKTKFKEESKLLPPPYTNNSVYNSLNDKNSTTTNTYSSKTILNNFSKLQYTNKIEVEYKISIYNYLRSSLPISISTLEIRSPS